MSSQAPMSVEPLLADSEANLRDGGDADSLFAESLASDTASITSSIMRFREENGRTYHAFREGLGYVLPNDADEIERLDIQHHLFIMTFDKKLYTCPAGSPGKPLGRVLDAGTGTGIWAMDFADEHPEAEVIGVDLSPIQPRFVPPNVNFYVDDIEDDWTFSSKFDFIYSRMLTASIGDWPKFISRSFEYLNPGGWMEIADILLELESDDGTVPPGCPLQKWGEYMLEAADVYRRPLDSPKFYKKQLEAAGYINVVETIYKWPTNPWPRDQKFKEMGTWTYANLGVGMSGLSMALFTRALGWKAEEVEIFVAGARKDMRNPSIHGYFPIYVVYGQKPE